MRTSSGRFWLLFLGLCGLLGSFVPLLAHAASIAVNSLADPGTGGCDATECTLREALAAARDGETITFAPALFTSGPGTITLTAGELVLDHDVTIVGPGRHLLGMSGNRASRVVRILAGVVASIEKVTIMQGRTDGDGGGLANKGTLTLRQSTVRGNTAAFGGGGLDNRGTLMLQQSTVSDNTAGYGGGITTHRGTLTLQRSTIRGNTATRNGGGLYNSTSGTLTLRQSTVSGNTASGSFSGGGISNDGTLTLDRSTVSGNTASEGGGIFTHRGTLTLRTTLVAGNTASTGPDCSQQAEGTLRSRGYNLTGTATGCPSDAARGDVTVDPALVFTQVLGPLQDNGGPTFTHALLPGSPALDAGDPDQCGGRDQRGVPRPQGAGCDIGAFEREE